MQVCFVMLGNDMVAEVELEVTSRGEPPSHDDPGEGAEFTVKLLELRYDVPMDEEAENPALEIPAWLRDMIEAHLQEDETCIEAANAPEDERDPDEAREEQQERKFFNY